MRNEMTRLLSRRELEQWIRENPHDQILVREVHDLTTEAVRAIGDHTLEVCSELYQHLKFEITHAN